MAEKNKPRRGRKPPSRGIPKSAKPSAPPVSKAPRTRKSPSAKKPHSHAHDHVHEHAHAHDGKRHSHPHAHHHVHAHDAHDHGHDHDHGHAHDHEHHDHAHGHDHAHDHDHDHDHDHPHGHAHATVSIPQLAEGAGKGKILFFDAPSGLAGDMTIAALVDLGVPTKVIEDAVAAMPITGFHLHFGTREKSGIVATAFDVHVEDAQPERTFGEIRKMIERAKLAPPIKARALATFRRLAEAEARVHRMPIDDVHFHEVGAVDAIVDVVGSAAALAWLDATVLVSPLPMGHGKVRARHGILPLPPPAVVECLRGFPTYDAGIAFELVTPTGAAIVAAHAAPVSSASGRWPSMTPERTGFGAGTADLADRANLLRVVLGTPNEAPKTSSAATHVVLEANIDDATGEILAVCIEELLRAGALDAWATPVTMKKGRPAYVLAALAVAARADDVTQAMLRESTSIGVRRTEVSRVERPRRIEGVKTRFGMIPVKVSEGPFGPPVRKPELDACVAAARAHGVPVREVVEVVKLASSAAAARAARAEARSPRRSPSGKGRKRR